MNHIFKVVWSKTKHCYVVVSEIAKQTGKNKVKSVVTVHGVFAVTAMLVASVITGGNVDASYAAGGAVANKGAQSFETAVAIGSSPAAGLASTTKYPTDTKALGEGTVAIGTGAYAVGDRAVAIGDQAKADQSKKYALAVGSGAKALHEYAIAVGGQNEASGNRSIAIGQGAKALGERAYAIGGASKVSSASGIGLGWGTEVSSTSGIAIGSKGSSADSATTVTALNGIAIGAGASATVEGAIALGVGSTTENAVNTPSTTINNVQYDFAGGSPASVVSIGKSAVSGNVAVVRQIQNVAAGRISDTSTDAINGSQLYAVLNQGAWKTNVTAGLGSDAKTASAAQSATSIKFGDTVNFAGGSNVTIDKKIDTIGNINTVTYTINSKIPTMPSTPQNYFHVNDSDVDMTGSGGTNQDSVSGRGNALGGKSIAAGVGSIATHRSSVTIGDTATSTGVESIAIGFEAQANGGHTDITNTNDRNESESSVAIGSRAVAQKSGVAVGGKARAKDNSVSIGDDAGVEDAINAVAIGNKALAYNTSVAVGQDSVANGLGAIGVGQNVHAKGAKGVAIGQDALVDVVINSTTGSEDTSVEHGAVAVGYAARVDTNSLHSVAIGQKSQVVSGKDGVAIGHESSTQAEEGIAIGKEAIAGNSRSTDDTSGGVAVGASAQALGKQSIAIGKTANGTKENAFAGGFEATASGKDSTALGANAQAQGDNSTAVGKTAKSLREKAFAGGFEANASGTGSTALGASAVASNVSTTAVGTGAIASRGSATAVGAEAKAEGVRSFAAANSAIAGAESSIAIGDNSKVAGSAVYSIAIGSHAYIQSDSTTDVSRSVAIGYGASGSAKSVVAVGNKTSATIEGSIALGQDSVTHIDKGVRGFNEGDNRTNSYTTSQNSIWTSTKAALSLGQGKANGNNNLGYTRQINHVAAGRDDDDAVNVAQLKSVNLQIAGNATAVGTPTSSGAPTSGADVRLMDQTLTVKGAPLNAVGNGVDTSADARSYIRSYADNNDISLDLTEAAKRALDEAWKHTTVSVNGGTGGREATATEAAVARKNDGQDGTGNLTIVEGSNLDKGKHFDIKLTKKLKDLTSVVVGERGKDGRDGETGTPGVDGTIGVNGKDGSSVVLNGKDGSIGLHGKDGENGLTIRGEKGPAGVKGADGETKTRIEYKYVDPKDSTQTITEKVATLNDGMKYYGDAITGTDVIKKKLNEQVNVIGGITNKTLLADVANVGVISNGKDNLTIRLAKSLTGIESVGRDVDNNISFTGDNNGVTIKGGNVNVSDNKITNVAPGTDGTDAVNVNQLNNVANEAKKHTTVSVNSGTGGTAEVKDSSGVVTTQAAPRKNDGANGQGNLTIEETTNAEGGYHFDVKLNKKIALGSDADKKVVIDGTTGQIVAGDKATINGNAGTANIGGIRFNGNNAGNIVVYDPITKVTSTGTGNTITGLGNKYFDPTKITSGQAATEDQLKQVNTELTDKITNHHWVVSSDKTTGATSTAFRNEVKNTNEVKFVGTGAAVVSGAKDNNGVNTITVHVDAGQTPNLTYKATNNGTSSTAQSVSLTDGLNFTGGKYTTATADANGVVKYDVTLSTAKVDNGKAGIAGTNGKDGKDGIATIGEVVNLINNTGWKANAKADGGKLDGTPAATVVKAGDTVNYAAGKNLTVKQTLGTDEQTYTYSLNSEINLDKVVVGEKGTPGAPGKDGVIGLIGKDGQSAVMIVKKGQNGVDGTNGNNGTDGITRIVYKDENGKDHEVATMRDGLKFKGDDSTVIAKKLNEQLDIVGGADNTKLTDKNIGVNSTTDGKLKIQLAKELKDLSKVEVKDDDGNSSVTTPAGTTVTNKAGDTTVYGPNGITITPVTPAGATTPVKPIVITGDNISMGDRVIHDVAPGTDGTDAVNLNQLKGARTIVEAGDNIEVTANEDKTTGAITYTVKGKDNGAKTSTEKVVLDSTVTDNIAKVTTASGNAAGEIGETYQVGVSKADVKNAAIEAVTVSGDNKAIKVTPKPNTTTNSIDYNVTFNGTEAAKQIPLTYKANGGTAAADQAKTVTLNQGLDFTAGDYLKASIDDNGVVKYEATFSTIKVTDGKAGIAGTDGKNGQPGQDGKDGIATIGEVVKIVNNAGWNANATGNVDGSAAKTVVKAGDTVNYAAGKNLTVKQTIGNNEQTYTYSLDKNLTDLTSVTVGEKGEPGQNGQPGKDGVDGTIGVNGKDGTSVVINGKDGSIGINGKDGKNGASISGKDGVGIIGLRGPKGADGSDGTNAKIGVVYGSKGIDGNDGKDGLSKTRIVYEKPNGEKEEVATLRDGLYFKGDDATIISRKLNAQLDIIGGADSKNLTANNIGVNSDNGKLKLQLAKDIREVESIGKSNDNNITFNGNGNGVTITGGNVDVSGNKITNLAEGTNGTDAVNVNQLNAAKSAVTWKLTTNNVDGGTQSGTATEESISNDKVTFQSGKNLDIKQDGKTITYSLQKDLKDLTSVTVGEKGEPGQNGQPGKDGVDGTIGVNGKDGSSVVINGKDGSIGLNGKDGKNGVTISGKDGVGTIGLTGPAGKDGKDAKATISVQDGTKGLDGNDGKDGESKTRIVYEKPDGNKEEVATLNDGLKFKGDDSTVINKKLNEQLDIIGGADSKNLTANNIGVNSDNGKLKIQLAKDIREVESIGKSDNNKITFNGNGNGVTITGGNVSVSGNKITNVAEGTAGTDAVNVNQLNESLSGVKSTVTSGDNNVVVTPQAQADGHTNYEVKLADKVTLGTDVNKQISVDGSTGIIKAGKSITIDGVNGTIKAGDKVTIDGNKGNATIGGVTINGDKTTGDILVKDAAGTITKAHGSTITGLDNKVFDSNQITSGQAATEDQLKQVNDDLGNKITSLDNRVTTVEGDVTNLDNRVTKNTSAIADTNIRIDNLAWKVNTGEVDGGKATGSTSTKVSDGTEVKIQAGKNLQVDQAGTTITYSLQKDLKGLTSVEVTDGKGNSTVTTPMNTTFTNKKGDKAVVNAEGMVVRSKHGDTVVYGSTGLTIMPVDTSGVRDPGHAIVITEEKVSMGDRIIHDVAPGEEGTDAVNVNQLRDTKESVIWKLTTNAVDGGTQSGTVSEESVSNETVKLQAGKNLDINQAGKTVTFSLQRDLEGLNSVTFDGGNTTINNGGISITGGTGGSTVKVTKDGLDNGGNRITNVAEGKDGTDAVNVNQLKNAIGNITNVGVGEAHRAGAHAAALAALKPLQYDPLEPTQVMAGVGTYHSETAAAIGVAHFTKEHTMFHAGVTLGNHNTMVNAGVTRKFGWSPEKKAVPDRYKAGPISSVYVMQDEVSSLKEENARMKAREEALTNAYSKLQADNKSTKDELVMLRNENEETKAKLAMLMSRLGM